LEVSAAGLESLELLVQVEGVLAMAAVEVIEDGLGQAVEGLAAEAVESGASCDVAVAAEGDGGGAGEAVEQ
jgi:hypothetical protein